MVTFVRAMSLRMNDPVPVFGKEIRTSHCSLNDVDHIYLPLPQRPFSQEWGSGLEAVQTALTMERFINDKLLDLHWLAQQKNDPHVSSFFCV